MLAGARSFTAIAEWATDADEETLARLGVTGKVPAESTIRRVLQRLDVDAFDKLAGAWAAQRTAPVAGRRRVVAVDGKTLRGSGRGGQDAPHLLAALDHAHGAVLGHRGRARIRASLRNLVITILRLAGAASIAAALRYHARRPRRPLQTIMKC
jgi:hypothetical protein